MNTSQQAESRADLHVHSRHSDRPSEWFLRRIGSPESFVQPATLYQTCRERGMDFVTITDHNTIAGGLEIAGFPNTFLSSEVTTYFPENGCKMHVLVFGITEKWFSEIQALRPNICELQAYLIREGILHSVSHPLFRVNDKLTVDQFEKLILLFNRFEGLNGSRCPQSGDVLSAILGSLTPGTIQDLATRHSLTPVGPEPWKKLFTGGSDDHSGLHTAHAYTITPRSATVLDYLLHMKEGAHRPGGQAGTSIRLAHSLYQIAYQYYRERFAGDRREDGILGEALRQMSGRPAASSRGPWSALGRIGPLSRFIRNRRRQRLGDIERLLVDEFSAMMEDSKPPPAGVYSDEQTFHRACTIGHRLSFAFIQQFMDQIRKGSVLQSLQSVSSLIPVGLGMAPYLTAFGSQHKDAEFIRTVRDRFPSAMPDTRHRLWFTDTLNDINGVTNTIRSVAGEAAKANQRLTVVTCLAEAPQVNFPLVNFEPVGAFNLPEYESQKIVLPPFLEVLDFIEKSGADELIISTPGPFGLIALAAGLMFHMKMRGIYHTDFPRYIHRMTEDDQMEDLTWRYMQWFYGKMDTVYVPSRYYRDQLTGRGIAPEKIAILSRGVDRGCFSPDRRDPRFWNTYGINGSFKFLYVGRVSREKNLDLLLTAFNRFLATGRHAHLIMVGDGPYLEDIRRRFQQPEILFTGFLKGEALATAYASADVFVFPSTTDTFGNAVLEAHACGLPAVVSDKGGPREIVESHRSGLVVDASTPEPMAEAMLRLHDSPALREQMGAAALLRAEDGVWDSAMRTLLTN